jgi:hypothetical protein
VRKRQQHGQWCEGPGCYELNRHDPELFRSDGMYDRAGTKAVGGLTKKRCLTLIALDERKLDSRRNCQNEAGKSRTGSQIHGGARAVGYQGDELERIQDMAPPDRGGVTCRDQIDGPVPAEQKRHEITEVRFCFT